MTNYEMSLLDRVEGKDYDDRTVAEQLRDLNVEVVTNRPKISGVKWVQRSKRTKPVKRKPKKPHISFSGKSIYFNVTATKILSPIDKRLKFGVADYTHKGKTVKALLLREGGKGYTVPTMTRSRSKYAQIASYGLLRQLESEGLKYGRYELIRVNDGWIGVPMAEEGVRK